MAYDRFDDYQRHVDFYTERRLSRDASREPVRTRKFVRHDGEVRVWDEAVQDLANEKVRP